MGDIGLPLDRGVRSLLIEPLREHSRKPDRIRDDIVRLYCDRPRCELFSRTETPGWQAWGNQVDKFAGQESNLQTGPLSEAAFPGGPLDGGPARSPATETV